MLSHTRMGVPYEYTHMGRPIRVWAKIRIWGRTASFGANCTLYQQLGIATVKVETSSGELVLL